MFFFSDWSSILRILVIGVGAYIGLVITLRSSGNRTLSKMNSFDFVITIALGSTFASAILDKNVALSDALVAFLTLTALQFVVTWASIRSRRVDRLLKANPVLLFSEGTFLVDAMKKSHVSKEEVLAGMRQAGFGSVSDVGFVVLEANGKIIAVPKGDRSILGG